MYMLYDRGMISPLTDGETRHCTNGTYQRTNERTNDLTKRIKPNHTYYSKPTDQPTNQASKKGKQPDQVYY